MSLTREENSIIRQSLDTKFYVTERAKKLVYLTMVIIDKKQISHLYSFKFCVQNFFLTNSKLGNTEIVFYFSPV